MKGVYQLNSSEIALFYFETSTENSSNNNPSGSCHHFSGFPSAEWTPS